MADKKKVAIQSEAEDADALLEIQKNQAQAIDQGYALFSSHLNELTLASGDPAMFDELETLLDQSNFDIDSKIRLDKLKAIYHHVISRPARMKALKKLVDMLVILNRMEAEALACNKSNSVANQRHEILSELGRKLRKDIESKAERVIKEE